MTRFRKYIDLTIDSSTLLPGGAPFAASQAMKALHLFNSRLDPLRRVAVAFPLLIGGKGFPGRHIRFFAISEDDLAFLVGHPLIRGLAQYDGMALSATLDVPKDCLSAVFRRDRITEKQCVGHAERAYRRAMRKSGEASNVLSMQERLARIRDNDEGFFVSMTSQSTGQGYRLYIRSEETEKEVWAQMTSYGLAGGIDGLMATVPVF